MNPNPAQNQHAIPDPVIRVWTKGRFYPFIYGLGWLLATAGYSFMIVVTRPATPGEIVTDVILAILTILTFAAGFRRKLTLTQHTLVIRRLFNTRILPLRDITAIYVRRGSSNSLFARYPACFSTNPTGQRPIGTKSFGAHNQEGMRIVAEAAMAAGAKIFDWNTEREVFDPRAT